MRNKFTLLLILFIVICFGGCQKTDNGRQTQCTVNYFLTPAEKQLIAVATLGDSIMFFDSVTNNRVTFYGNQGGDLTTYDCHYDYPGEITSTYYLTKDTMYQRLIGEIQYNLYASTNSDCFLYWYSGLINPNDMNKADTIYYLPSEYKNIGLWMPDYTTYKLLDSISLAGLKFYNVFNLYYTDTLNIKHNSYYTRDKGWISILDRNNNFWIRGN